jgi:hypothetical protein
MHRPDESGSGNCDHWHKITLTFAIIVYGFKNSTPRPRAEQSLKQSIAQYSEAPGSRQTSRRRNQNGGHP